MSVRLHRPGRLLVAAAIAIAASSSAAHAAVPTIMGFTARLADSAGVAASGQRRLVLSLFDAASEGKQLWTESQDATFVEGVVNLTLGATVPIDAAVLAGGKVFLEIKVADVVMQPRLAVASVPFAIRSGVAELAEGVVPGASINVATVAAQRVLEGGLGGSRHEPAASCADLHTRRGDLPSGVYWLQPSSTTVPFRAYCDMATDGGGWTLVWSNLRGGKGKPVTEMQWLRAISTLPVVAGTLSTDLESFTVYTGLKHWLPLSPGKTLRYAWSSNYDLEIQQAERCAYNLTGATYVISFDESTCSRTVGTVDAGLFKVHNGQAFSAYDADNDVSLNVCGTLFSNTPWWYADCWNGSLNGGGENSVGGYFNGAYWTGTVLAWGTPDGNGAGNGWIYVR